MIRTGSLVYYGSTKDLAKREIGHITKIFHYVTCLNQKLRIPTIEKTCPHYLIAKSIQERVSMYQNVRSQIKHVVRCIEIASVETSDQAKQIESLLISLSVNINVDKISRYSGQKTSKKYE
jgi:hypothetical protein